MSYGVSSALQRAIFERLDGAPAVGAVFDSAPEGALPPNYVVIGAEDVRDRSFAGGALSEHRIVLSVFGDGAGFAGVKTLAGVVSDLMLSGLPALERGRVVSQEFVRARARRLTGSARRRIDLTFRVTVEDD